MTPSWQTDEKRREVAHALANAAGVSYPEFMDALASMDEEILQKAKDNVTDLGFEDDSDLSYLLEMCEGTEEFGGDCTHEDHEDESEDGPMSHWDTPPVVKQEVVLNWFFGGQ